MNSAMVLSIARHVLTAAGAWAVTKGYLDSATLEQVVGAVLTIAAVIWGAVDKKGR